MAAFELPWLVHRHSMPSVSSGVQVGRSVGPQWDGTGTGNAEYSLYPWKDAQTKVEVGG